MKLKAIKEALQTLNEVQFLQTDGNLVPLHFHLTEIGRITKHFIDCGGTERIENVVNFQLWEANDFEHRLSPDKLLNIIALSEKTLGISEELEVEVEYQQTTIGKFGLEFNGKQFVLTSKTTACLASDQCGIPPQKQKIALSQIGKQEASACCTPGSGCC